MASSLITGGTGITVVTLVPPVEWILNGCPHPIPESVPYLIAAGILMCCHAAFNYFNKDKEPQAQTSQVPHEPIQSSPYIQGVNQNVVVPDVVGTVDQATPISSQVVQPTNQPASRSNI